MKTRILLVMFVFAIFNCSAQYTKLLDFAGGTIGMQPYGDLVSVGTFLYGTTNYGGTSNLGTIFKIKPDGTGFGILLDFVGAANGSRPHGSLISDGTFLYGMTSVGGTSNDGTIFKIKPDGSGYAKLFDFTSSASGAYPFGSLVSDGIFLYGMTWYGGTSNKGVLFKIKPDGTNYAKLLDFIGGTNGSEPHGSLVSDGTFLYGMTTYGGPSDMGTIFKIKPDGTSYAKLHDFTGGTDGWRPFGSLVSDGSFLYGMTALGNSTDNGIIFKIKPNGTGYAKLHDFGGMLDGANSSSSLIFQGPFLYGMTGFGGTADNGTIFKIKSDGTSYSKLLDFTGTANGGWPNGSLVSDGTYLYGTTFEGGTNNLGTIFKYGVATGIIENNAVGGFYLYPNPSNGVFIIQIDKNQMSIKNAQLSIYNVLGERIYSLDNAQLNTSQIDLSNQPNGIYFINLKTEQGTLSQKIIINK